MRGFQQTRFRLKWAGTYRADANESAARAVLFVAHCARFCVLQKFFFTRLLKMSYVAWFLIPA
jgi:hypothetical protein